MVRTGCCEPDWTAIRAAYEANETSIRALATERGISDTAIRKRAKKAGWQRAPQPARRDRGMVAAAPPTETAAPPADDAPPTVAEAAAAVDPKDLVAQGRDIVHRLLDELGATTTHIGEIEELIDDETSGDRDGRRRFAMHKAVDLPSRALVAKNLAQAAKTLADMNTGTGSGAKKDAKEPRPASRFATAAPPRLVVDNGNR